MNVRRLGKQQAWQNINKYAHIRIKYGYIYIYIYIYVDPSGGNGTGMTLKWSNTYGTKQPKTQTEENKTRTRHLFDMFVFIPKSISNA